MKKIILKIWLSAIILSPIFYIIFLSLKNTFNLKDFLETFSDLFIYAVWFGLVYSIPAVVIFDVIAEIINIKVQNYQIKILFFTAILISLQLITFFLIFGKPELSFNQDLIMELIYILTTAIFCLYYFIKGRKRLSNL